MFDLTPLYRSTVGFDRLGQLLDELNSFEAPTYPPYNIERLEENEYRITMAVAGFAPDELNLEIKDNTLTVSGRKSEKVNGQGQFLHQGIAARSFERRFQLADYVEVEGADMENGLLHIKLRREIPESMKPRTIPIGKTQGQGPKTIEGKRAA